MDGINETAVRDANGRFAPGSSGNPAGKKPGTRNRATILREALAEGEGVAAARIVIDKALAGDAVAARFIVDRLTPRPRGRAIALDLPRVEKAADALAASNATIAAMASGEITPDEALTVTRVLDGRLRALKAAARAKFTRAHEREPSPSGRGQGEGRRNNLNSSSPTPSRHPHPNPPEKMGDRSLRPSPPPLALGAASPRLTRQRGRVRVGDTIGVRELRHRRVGECPHPALPRKRGRVLLERGCERERPISAPASCIPPAFCSPPQRPHS